VTAPAAFVLIFALIAAVGLLVGPGACRYLPLVVWPWMYAAVAARARLSSVDGSLSGCHKQPGALP
jgi:hypothetical protein